MKNLLLSVGLCLVLVSAAFGQKTIERTFDGIDEIDMSLGSGDAVFEKGSGDKVQLVLRHSFDSYQPTIEKRGDKLFIREEQRNGNWSRSGSATWTFTIPDGLELEFNTGSGDVSVEGLEMDARVNSGSGDFEIASASGEYKMNTGSGDVEIRKSEGRYRMNTGSGDVELSDVAADIDANTGSGDIEADGLTVAGSCNLNSGSGDVEVSLAGPLDYDISVNSGSGDAVVDFNGAKIEGTIVMQANKRHGRIVAPFKFDTEEEIDNGGSSPTLRKTVKLGDKDVRINIGTGSGTAQVKE